MIYIMISDALGGRERSGLRLIIKCLKELIFISLDLLMHW